MKTSIRQILTLFVALVAAFMLTTAYLSQKQNAVRDEVLSLDKQAFEISQQASRLNVIVADYNLYRRSDSLTQWSNTLDKIEKQAGQLLNITQLEEKMLAKRLSTDISRVRMQFERLSEATIDKDIQWITINLNTYSQNLITQLHNLSEEARQLATLELSRLSWYQTVAVGSTTFLALVVLVVLYTALIVPLKTVRHEMKKIGQDYAHYDSNQSKNSRIREWHELFQSLEEMYRELQVTTVSKKALVAEVEMRKEAEENAVSLARTDFLTGLPNRLSFFERFKVLLENNRSAFLFFLDIDNFKSVNDNLGHLAGDTLLKTVSAAILQLSDERDSIARLGGDEFAILHFADSEQEALLFARELQALVRLPVTFESTQLRIDCSIGIARYPDDGVEIKSLLSCADTAMFFAKRNPVSTSGIQRFTVDIGEASRRKFSLYHKLRRAVEQGSFEVWFQPQVEVGTLNVTGFEALLRWKQDNGSYVSPSVFVPMLERTVDIIRVGEFVFEKCIEFQRRLESNGFTHTVSINISAVQLEHEHFIPFLKRRVLETGLSASRFPLELTETAIFRNKQETLLSLDRLKQMGFALQLDDFGTGNASLDLLKNFPFSTVKIDSSFTKEAANKPETRAIIKAITLLSKELSFDVVIEGVETVQQQAFAREYGIKVAQGFYYAKAMPMNEAIAWLEHYDHYSTVL
jgi:diguanylate cyclase (GGDEF)-like protein